MKQYQNRIEFEIGNGLCQQNRFSGLQVQHQRYRQILILSISDLDQFRFIVWSKCSINFQVHCIWGAMMIFHLFGIYVYSRLKRTEAIMLSWLYSCCIGLKNYQFSELRFDYSRVKTWNYSPLFRNLNFKFKKII